MKKVRTRSVSQSNAKSTREFTPLQEKDNDYELAGPTEWLPDPRKRGVRFDATACPDAGARRCHGDRFGDLECSDHAGCAARQRARRRRRSPRCSRGTDAEPG